jgi:ATP-dependent DNA ligase
VNLPLSRRRKRLESLLNRTTDPVRLSPLLRAPSGQVLEAGRKLGLDGVVANGSVPYTSPASDQARGSSSVQIWEQEFVIGGYVPGSRGFDALHVGVYKNKELIFAAKVKNGFVPRVRDEFFPALKTLKAAHCPFKNLPEKKASRWGESLTAEKMKKPAEVVRET